MKYKNKKNFLLQREQHKEGWAGILQGRPTVSTVGAFLPLFYVSYILFSVWPLLLSPFLPPIATPRSRVKKKKSVFVWSSVFTLGFPLEAR